MKRLILPGLQMIARTGASKTVFTSARIAETTYITESSVMLHFASLTPLPNWITTGAFQVHVLATVYELAMHVAPTNLSYPGVIGPSSSAVA